MARERAISSLLCAANYHQFTRRSGFVKFFEYETLYGCISIQWFPERTASIAAISSSLNSFFSNAATFS